HRALVGPRQELVLVLVPALPHRPDRVHDPGRRQVEARRRDRAADLAALELATRGRQLRPRRRVDRAVDPTAPGELRVGGVDDHVDRQARDVALLDHHPPIAIALHRPPDVRSDVRDPPMVTPSPDPRNPPRPCRVSRRWGTTDWLASQTRAASVAM